MTTHILKVQSKQNCRKDCNSHLVKRILQHIQPKSLRVIDSVLSEIVNRRNACSASQCRHTAECTVECILNTRYIRKSGMILFRQCCRNPPFNQVVHEGHQTDSHNNYRRSFLKLPENGTCRVAERISDNSDTDCDKNPFQCLFLSLADFHRLLFLFKVGITLLVIWMLCPQLICSFLPLAGISLTFSAKVFYRFCLFHICRVCTCLVNHSL